MLLLLLLGYLQPSVQSPWNGDALGGVAAVGRDGGDQAVQLFSFFLQFLDQALDSSPTELKNEHSKSTLNRFQGWILDLEMH